MKLRLTAGYFSLALEVETGLNKFYTSFFMDLTINQMCELVSSKCLSLVASLLCYVKLIVC